MVSTRVKKKTNEEKKEGKRTERRGGKGDGSHSNSLTLGRSWLLDQKKLGTRLFMCPVANSSFCC